MVIHVQFVSLSSCVVQVTFSPEHPVLHSEKILMACDNGQVITFTISGMHICMGTVDMSE